MARLQGSRFRMSMCTFYHRDAWQSRALNDFTDQGSILRVHILPIVWLDLLWPSGSDRLYGTHGCLKIQIVFDATVHANWSAQPVPVPEPLLALVLP